MTRGLDKHLAKIARAQLPETVIMRSKMIDARRRSWQVSANDIQFNMKERASTSCSPQRKCLT